MDVCASFGLCVVRGAERLLKRSAASEVAYMSIYHSQCTLVACFSYASECMLPDRESPHIET